MLFTLNFKFKFLSKIMHLGLVYFNLIPLYLKKYIFNNVSIKTNKKSNKIRLLIGR